MASGNGISGLLNFNIFWGSMPPDPLDTGVSGAPLAGPPPAHKFLATAMEHYLHPGIVLYLTTLLSERQEAMAHCKEAGILRVRKIATCRPILVHIFHSGKENRTRCTDRYELQIEVV